MTASINWWTPQIGDKEKRLIIDVLDKNFPNEGQLTTEFEKKIANLLGAKYAVAVTSGTSAIFLSLKALNIGYGDEVIVPDMTFIATANAVEMTGAKPVLVDIDPKTLNMAPESFKKAIAKNTKAVIPVHVSGRASDMQSIMEIARKHSIEVVEDAAEALMSKHKQKFLGTFGKFGCFSFSPNKTITTGQGGIIVTNDEKLHVRLRELKDNGRPVRGTGGDDLHESIGYNFKFTDLQAAVGLGQLEYLGSRIKRMRKIHKIYVEQLKDIDGISLYYFDIEHDENPQWTDAFAEKRNEIDKYLSQNGISCRRYWFPIHRQMPYKMPDDRFPNSTRMSPRSLWLPSAFTLTDKDVEFVCNHIKKFFKKK